jgi:predicted RecB family nuclease
MHRQGPSLTLTATDLAGFSECGHKTWLDLAVLNGELERPGVNEIERQLLEKRGHEHEARVLGHFRERGLEIVEIGVFSGGGSPALIEAAQRTAAAMSAGADVIYQAVLYDERWLGRPDFLLKCAGPSRFGDYHYQVVDAKLASVAQARAVLQLCVYTDYLERLQGTLPEEFVIAPGGRELVLEPLRTLDYMAYYRAAKARFEGFVECVGDSATYPEPVEHCAICRWWKRCELRRRKDDHLSLVAGISARQRDRLSAIRVTTLSGLAKLDSSVRVDGIGDPALCRVREQARIQFEGRSRGEPVYELLLDAEPGSGLERLPAPQPGDLFFDLEGDPFVRGEGLEYLFGLLELGEPSHGDAGLASRSEPRRYHAFWAHDRAGEKRAFEAVIDRIVEGRARCADLHVFHYGHREAEAIKRLACRHKTREDAVDELLRRQIFVDLHAVVRRALRASVESYSLKELERFYAFERKVELRAAAQAMQLHGFWLETAHGEPLVEFSETIATYNRDDCLSASALRDWLERCRDELATKLGRPVPRPTPPEETPNPEAPRETARVVAALSLGLPEDPAADDAEQAAKRLLSDLLDWHWREAKSGYWEYFRAKDVPHEERLEDRAILAPLTFVGEVRTEKQSKVYRYEFQEQEHAIRRKPGALDADTAKAAGEVMDLGSTYIELKRGVRSSQGHPRALMPGRPIPTKNHAARLLAIGESVVAHGLAASEPYAAARALLRRCPPSCGQPRGAPLVAEGADTGVAIERLALSLQRSVLAVQGPPGSGKTHRAARMIVALVRAGKRVGVTANSHQVIVSLLEKAHEVALELGAPLRIVHMSVEDPRDETRELPFEVNKDYAKLRARLDAGQLDVLGGTSWAFTAEVFEKSVDVLVVDEAGQMSLANVLAVSPAAESLVLFGDPAQLDQPQKGVHPPGADASALEHLLAGALTMPPDRGVFLPETRRLHPAICAFTSTVFYEGRLQSLPGLEAQRVNGPEPFSGSGVRFVPVEHRGNTNGSEEEVACIERLVDALLAANATFTDKEGRERPLQASDLLVVAPYNTQVAALRRRLPRATPVGTVDKFQGQEAPIVIYSLTSSSSEDAPRGLEFLYSLNRLNVATSRAQALVVLVGNPELARARCRTPRQMQLVNGLCSYLELAMLRA